MKEKRQMDLGKDNLRGLVLKVALPVVAAQLVNMLYNIVDRMYIGRIADIGTVALAGVGVCLPISILIMAFSQLVGSGGAPQASIELGKSNHTKAEKILGSCMVPLVVIAAILTAVLLMFGKRLLPILGATGASQPYAWEYLKITSLGTIFTVFVMGLNSFINTQGKTGVGMFSVIIGAVLNIIFDPVLIFGFHMGGKGCRHCNCNIASDFVPVGCGLFMLPKIVFANQGKKPCPRHENPEGCYRSWHSTLFTDRFGECRHDYSEYGPEKIWRARIDRIFDGWGDAGNYDKLHCHNDFLSDYNADYRVHTRNTADHQL